ncbi:hypothetical protein HGR_02703 [Hylemonella gracilis ATCC 19624]|uniref:Uncharacterized protein n=2 Tax=Hylemonella gracilis TaxID=80880 RepID=F3KQ28_9BURK|nr:hypothetical protein HGR_02703 [Hylemonella gracilis ATCC 19624]
MNVQLADQAVLREYPSMPSKKSLPLEDNTVPVTSCMKAVPEAEEQFVGQVIKRPGGYYWSLADAEGKEGREYGPYETFAEAQADMEAAADLDAPEPGESLEEAESELGIADWIDPETGEPAEGQSRPHLDD